MELPYEILNIIFSYIESNTNQIMKNQIKFYKNQTFFYREISYNYTDILHFNIWSKIKKAFVYSNHNNPLVIMRILLTQKLRYNYGYNYTAILNKIKSILN